MRSRVQGQWNPSKRRLSARSSRSWAFSRFRSSMRYIDEETLQEGRRDHTAYQWCGLGFVPIAEARWRLTRYGGNSAWYYCSPWDVRYDPDRAKELLETGPREYDRLPDGRPYDGRPWWQT